MWSDQIPSFRSFDGPFTFTSARGGEGRCYLSVYEHTGTLPVVIAYELASNHGPSVTTAAASIATQVWRQLLPDAKEGIIFVEAYKDTQRLAGESSERFAEVTFDLDSNALHSPRWRHIERADVEALIGGPASTRWLNYLCASDSVKRLRRRHFSVRRLPCDFSRRPTALAKLFRPSCTSLPVERSY